MTTPALDALRALLPLLARDEDRAVTGVFDGDTLNAIEVALALIGDDDADDAGLRHESEAALLAKLEAAEKENKVLREALAEKVTSETMLRDLSVGNGSIRASFEGGAVHLLVDALAGQFSESGAENYLEMRFHSDVTGPLAATLQRVNGKTPHQLREAAEKERDALRAENVSLVDDMNLLRDNNTALRARIEEMEKQESVATVIKEGDSRYWMSERLWAFPDGKYPLYALPGAQQCKNCNGMGDRFDPSGEKIPCDLCESHLEEIRSLVAEAAHDIISGSDFWLSISLAAKKIYALPGAQTQGEGK